MPTHETIEGESLTYDEPDGALAAFLSDVRAAVDDPSATEDDLVALVYGARNPLLDQTILPGHPMVTKATLAHPLWPVLVDLLGQKRVQLGTLDVAAARAEYTVTVAQAAEQLGLSQSAVRQAIAAKRLPSWLVDGQHRLHPQGIEAFALQRQQESRRGPAPRLDVRIGKSEPVGLRMKYPGELDAKLTPEPNLVVGTLSRWKRVAVLLSNDDRATLYVLEPGEQENKIKNGPFHVSGRFKVAEKITNAVKAGAAWRAFEAA